jgi:uncharacterized membrane protein
MASLAPDTLRTRSAHPGQWLDRIAGALALVLLAMVVGALTQGGAQLARLPWQLSVHIAALVVALALTPLLLWRAKGTRWHRRLGWTWAIAMGVAALVSFGLRLANDGSLSAIHILSVVVLIQAPRIVWLARRRNVSRHRRAARSLTVLALLTAGFLTFPFDRLMGRWLLG